MNFFTLGSKFSSFEALKAALVQYKKETHVEFFIRDCMTLEQSSRRSIKSTVNANRDLIYRRLKLYCIRGGRRFVSKSTGQRKSMSLRLGCQAYILISLSKCKQYLEVKDYDFEHNHELEPRPLQRKEARAEKRRQGLMKKLNMSYSEVLQLEKARKNQEEDIIAAKNHGISINEKNVLIDQATENDEGAFTFPEKGSEPEETPECTSIYTRTGDDGTSSTFNGETLYKDDKIFEAVGSVEELSSSIGFAIEFFPESCGSICDELREVQCVLQDLAVHVGTPRSHSTTFHRVNSEFPGEHVIKLENHIAKYTEKLPKLNVVILPSGGKGSSALHVARSVCRRAERRVAYLYRENEVNRAAIQYLNRLGDYLFAAARVVCICDEKRENVYEKPKIFRLVKKLYMEPVPNVIVENQDYQDCEVYYITEPEEFTVSVESSEHITEPEEFTASVESSEQTS